MPLLECCIFVPAAIAEFSAYSRCPNDHHYYSTIFTKLTKHTYNKYNNIYIFNIVWLRFNSKSAAPRAGLAAIYYALSMENKDRRKIASVYEHKKFIYLHLINRYIYILYELYIYRQLFIKWWKLHVIISSQTLIKNLAASKTNAKWLEDWHKFSLGARDDARIA